MKTLDLNEPIPRRIFKKFKYPKFFLFILTIILAVVIYKGRNLPFYYLILNSGFIGAFFSGFFFSYGFTASPATASFLILAQNQNIILTGILGGLGALTGDFIIFKFIRHVFNDEIKKISREKIFKIIQKKTPKVIQKFILPVSAGIIIASPLPDEIGIALLASARTISTRAFMIMSYTLNTIGIFIILLIGTAL